MKENYQLLDCGNYKKLEKFGDFIIQRPSPSAHFEKALTDDFWNQADFVFDKDKGWNTKNNPDNLIFKWKGINLKLYLTENGQVGVFPEHFLNWKIIFNSLKIQKGNFNILNGFAYTGAATIAASLLNNEARKINVTHVDSSKPAISKAKENARLSNVENNKIRWIQDDIISFMEKELKRENYYNGIILDPPAFGRGKGKKTWKLEKDLPYLVELSGKLMKNNPFFLILSCHDKNISFNYLQELISKVNFNSKGKFSKLNLTLTSKHGNSLPSGKTVYWIKQ